MNAGEREGLRVGRVGPIVDRLVARLEWRGDCLEWTGAINRSGYGKISERVNGKCVQHLAHRLTYARTIGDLPDGIYVLHSCDNPRCCNPEHLRLGTHEDNMRDRRERNRVNNGRRSITHCPSGHAYDAENTYVSPDGARKCRACHRRRMAEARRAA